MSDSRRLTSAERTAALLAHIDDTLATIHEHGKTRSNWTTREVEDLLLDLRNEIQLQESFDVYLTELETKLQGFEL